MGSHGIEESKVLQLDFEKLKSIALSEQKVVPVAVQDADSLEMLLIAYVNEEALRLTQMENRAVFYSTSRRSLWRKGETSGDVLRLREIRVNCEQNSLLFLVERATGAVCHTKDATGRHRKSCYYRRLTSESELLFTSEN